MKCKNVAHAGYGKYIPNSWESIMGIKETECDVLEVDVRKEGKRIYLSHDFRGDSTKCVGLEEVFGYLRENVPEKYVGIDLKEPVFEDVQKMAEYCGMDGKIIYSGCFFLKDLLKNRGENKVFYNLENSLTDWSASEKEMRQIAEVLREYGADGINIDYSMFSMEMASLLKSVKLEAAVWTVDSLDDMKRMLELGVSSITTRYPNELAAWMKQGEK